MIFRKLELADYEKGYLELLSQLTAVGDISKEDFSLRFNELEANPDVTLLVCEDETKGKIIGCGGLSIDRKFIHNCGKIGSINEIVIDKNYRNKKIGKDIVTRLTKEAELAGCYKVILSCREDNVGFYEKCGYVKKEELMAKYFE